MRPDYFDLHDVSDYPLVRFVGNWAVAGSARRWCAEMGRLVQGDQPFALIYPPGERLEAPEDRAMRAIWLKQNRAGLTVKCLALIVIEPDPVRRARIEAMFPTLIKAFGATQAARATLIEAEALARGLVLARRLLSGDAFSAPEPGPV